MPVLVLRRKAGEVSILYDEIDEELIQSYSWFMKPNGYIGGALRGAGARTAPKQYLHRLIMKPTSRAFVVDHINGNKLDNRRENLRVVSTSLNNFNQKLRSNNTHGFRGVSLHRQSGLWQARITIHKHRYDLGYFKTAEEAHEAYQKYATALVGDHLHPAHRAPLPAPAPALSSPATT